MENKETRSLDKLETTSKKLVLIDSNAIIHRAYHALPANMKNSKGELTNAVYGFTTTLIKVLEDLKPDYIAASFDVSKKTFRTEHYAEYKANRVKADQELYDQIPRVRELLSVLDIPIYELEGYEADDCIGTITKQIRNPKSEIRNKSENQNSNAQNHLTIYIVTGDKDLFQLVNGNVFVYSLKKGLSQMEIVDKEHIKDEYNLDPEDFIDLKALAGDPSDNIPGVPNIGKVTATTLLQQFDSLENLYEKIGASLENAGLISKSEFLISNQFLNSNDLNIKNSNLNKNLELKIKNLSDEDMKPLSETLNIKLRILRLLIEHKGQAFLSQKLATIHKEVPIEFDLEKSKWGEYDKDKLKDFFEEMQFHSLLRRFGADAASTKGGAGAPASAEGGMRGKTETAKKDEQLKLL